jgi:NADH-quinone oxidoreductase subunit G
VLGGARGTNEDAYAWARLAKGVLGTDNVDAQLGDGLPAEVVLGLPRAEIGDCDRAAAIVLLGPDLKEELPVLHLRVRRAAVELGIPVIDFSVSDPALTAQTISLRPAPGEAGAVAERLMRAVTSGAGGDRTVGGEAIGRAAAVLREREGKGPVVVVLGRSSLAERPDATMRAAAALAALPDVRFLSSLRRGNVHGALELGLAPGLLPGRMSLAGGRDAFTSAWGAVPEAPGLDATGILRAAVAGKIRVLVLLGCDPLTDFPDRALVRDAFDSVATVISVDAFLSDSTRRADVVLPATLWGEKQGTVTNLEGRVQRLGRKVAPAGSAMDDWRIAAELALRLGSDFDLEQVDEVTDEITKVAPAFAGASAELLREARDGVVLPVAGHSSEIVLRVSGLTILADDGPGASWEPIRAAGVAAEDIAGLAADEEDAGGAAEEIALASPAAPEPDVVWDRRFGSTDLPGRDAYALRLVTGHTLYDGGRAVTSSPSIAGLVHDTALLVSATDLARIGVVEGTTVKVTSSRTSLNIALRVDARLRAGVARLDFAPGAAGAADLIDVAAPVTDVRVETLR